MRRLIAPALLAFALTGCDVLDDLEPTESIAVPVSTIRLESVPEGPSAVLDWDEEDQTLPDVFVEIQNTAGLGIARSEVIQDADVSQPLTFTMPDGIEGTTADARLFIAVYDDDGGPLDADRISVSQSFSVEELQNSDGTIVLENSRPNRSTVYEVIR